jgi:transcriptional regulator with XRE-family HTH domain
MGRNYLIPPGTGARVKARRHELELTQAKLGALVSRHVKARYGWEKDYSDSWVRNIEHDKGSALLDSAIGLADALGVSMDWLYGRTIGPDIIIEADHGTAMVEVKQRLGDLDDALGPVDSLSGEEDAPIPLDEARRGRKRAGARPRRT